MAPQQPQIIGTSPRLREALELADFVARESISVVLRGETGTGKELFARRIHQKSERASGPFVSVNCSAISASLFESEVFGHEKGSFTGAHQARAGYFEQAHGGTLFLDEIGDMPLEHQAKVLRAIQEGEIRRVGASRDRPVDVRVIAASHRNLREAAKRGTFRHDLVYRLIGFELILPPLRERGEDILAIAIGILSRYHPGRSISPEAQERLLRYDWPGNIREVESVVRTAAIKARGSQAISVEHLPPELVPGEAASVAGLPNAVAAPAALAHAPAAPEAVAPEAVAPEAVAPEAVAPEAVAPAAAVDATPEAAGKEVSAPRDPVDTRLEAVLAFIKAHGQITAAEVRELLHLQRSQGLRVLGSWERRGKIVQQGKGRGVHYGLPGTGAEASAGLRCDGGEGEGQRARARGTKAVGIQAQPGRPFLPDSRSP